jgi:ribosomal protein L12E/L44/L45/RPP1/RPP2
MTKIKVSNYRSGAFDYIGSDRKYSIPANVKDHEIEVPDATVDVWVAQFTKDGLQVEVVKAKAAPPPPPEPKQEAKPAPAPAPKAEPSKATTETKSKSTTTSKKEG